MSRKSTIASRQISEIGKGELRFDECLIPEFDRYGRSFPVYFRVPLDLVREVESFLYTDKLPFRSKEELYRWTLCCGLLHLRQVEEFAYSTPLLQLPLLIYRPQQQIHDYEFFIAVENIITDLAALGHREPELHRFIAVIEGLIRCLPSEYDREKFQNFLERRRSSLLEAARWPERPRKKGYRAR